MGVSCQLRALAALPPAEKALCTHFYERGWTPRASLDTLDKREIEPRILVCPVRCLVHCTDRAIAVEH
jgi:hypothetical protein